MENKFEVKSKYSPAGDQPRAIEELSDGINKGYKHQVLLGATGTGKTYTMAKVIEKVQKPTLILAPNKTLAAQLYGEFKEFFPDNAVEYFVSYYDYYQPEAYVPASDTYIEKDSSVNDEIDALRQSATAALIERRDVIVVASVSCIYGLGSPEEYTGQMLSLREGMEIGRDEVRARLVDMQYDRNDLVLERSNFRIKGDVLDIFPASGHNCVRVDFFGDEIERISEFDPLTGEILSHRRHITIFPASHYVTSKETMKRAVADIKAELEERRKYFLDNNMYLEEERIRQRTNYDIEMMEEVGFCSGIENYSRHLIGKQPGEPPYTLLDFFPEDYLLFIDESHVGVPQVRGMYEGDRSRKMTLVEYGFRLPSALDNRPLKFDEFKEHINQVVFVSATPGPYELSVNEGPVVEQINRPTGLLDPKIDVRPVTHQLDDLLGEIKLRIDKNERVLVTTLTKKMAEDLTEYMHNMGIKVRYLHSEVKTLERMAIIRSLRLGEFDVLVGINLLREGLDIPEVSLVAVLDADKEGFLRSDHALIQTTGRAARNVNGMVIFYGDRITDSMARAIKETERRRNLQIAFNKEHNITPTTIIKEIRDTLEMSRPVEGDEKSWYTAMNKETVNIGTTHKTTKKELKNIISDLEKEMKQAAKDLNFEKAAALRDAIFELSAELAKRK